MKGVSVCLLLTGFSQAVHIYLHPFPSLSSASLSATQAGATLSHHLGLEYFESLGDNLDLFDGVVQEPFVGKGSSRALLLSIGEEYASGMLCLNTLLGDATHCDLSPRCHTLFPRGVHSPFH